MQLQVCNLPDDVITERFAESSGTQRHAAEKAERNDKRKNEENNGISPEAASVPTAEGVCEEEAIKTCNISN